MILLLIGLGAGIVSGMGMGGGTILIPALVLTINPQQHTAQSVNLLFFIPTAVVALIIHIKNKHIDFKMAVPIIAFGMCGSFVGSWLAMRLAGGELKRLFGFFLLAMSIYEMFRKGKND
ncbi:MAG: sulfite exporter TauE/SafE family protein [Clostridiaceae bacterium]|nr:sulfite exporter TauE/SafE family protein [Clostridiaceae bacterium]